MENKVKAEQAVGGWGCFFVFILVVSFLYWYVNIIPCRDSLCGALFFTANGANHSITGDKQKCFPWRNSLMCSLT